MKGPHDFLVSPSATVRAGHDGEAFLTEASYDHLGYFVAGGVASVSSRTITAPIDRLKIYLISQTSTQPVGRFKWDMGSRMISSFNALWEAGGCRSLWAGNGVNIVKMLPEGATKFGMYEATRRFFAALEGVEDGTQISVGAQFVSGGVGGVIAQFVAYPIDTLRFRMQCEMKRQGPHGNQLLAQTALQMWKSGGLRSYYRGLLWGLVGQYPYSALDLTIFEYTKQWYIRRNNSLGLYGNDAQPSSVIVATIGGFSGAMGASIVWPLNILRTRLQTQGTAIHPQTYTGIVDAANQLLNKEGARGFLKGITPNLMKVVPSVSITYVVYNKMKRYLDLP